MKTEGLADPGCRQPCRRLFSGLGSDLLSLFVLATVCLCTGMVLNQMHDHPLPLLYATKQDRLTQALARLDQDQGQASAALPQNPVSTETIPTPSMRTRRVIDPEEFQKFVQSKGGIILDARPEIFHRLGHVPGALSLSRDEFERDYAKLRATLEPSRDREIAVYCSSASCEDSQMVADALVKLGYRHVLVFKDGWSEWIRAGLPEEHS